MRRPAAPALLLALTALACGGASAPPATPAPAPAKATATVRVTTPDPSAALLGHWSWTSQVAGENYAGTMDLSRDGAAWKGRVLENAMGEMAVTALAVEGSTVTVTVQAGDSPAIVKATLQPDGTMTGKVETSGGEGTFSARKG
jgi:hypothetical protein